MNQQRNPSAFPQIKTVADSIGSERDGDLHLFSNTYSHGGMTLLDYFAGQALSGMMGCGSSGGAKYEDLAEEAYKMALAMLEERKRHLS